VETNATYTPLKNLAPEQVNFCVYNSLLSEAAVLAFDYGYSLDFPEHALHLGGPVRRLRQRRPGRHRPVLAAGESKWQRTSGIVLLLPHGYEGQGPEHSSARLERFLQLCAEDNIQVANITTPANFFHALRRQVKRDVKKPLVVMSPKSLLRHPAAPPASTNSPAAPSRRSRRSAVHRPRRRRPEIRAAPHPLLRQGVLRSLRLPREEQGHPDTAIVRLEQLYPLHRERLAEIARRYGDARLVWAQEESENMGAWSYIAPSTRGASSAASRSTPAASLRLPRRRHARLAPLELAALLKQAFTI
jgi:2-oxoglutarate dehydrogenase E1 component